MIVINDKQRKTPLYVIKDKYNKPQLTVLTETITENGVYVYTPNNGADGYSKANITVNIPQDIDLTKINYHDNIYTDATNTLNNYIENSIKLIDTYSDDYYYTGFNNILLFPFIDTSNRILWDNFFINSKLLIYVPPLTISDKCTSLGNTFNGCSNLTNIDATNWDISNVTWFARTFNGCTNLISINGLNNLKLNIEMTPYMFADCTSLDNVVFLSTWEVDGIQNMMGMFQNCDKLTKVDLSNWTSNVVTNMSYLFDGCTNIKYVNLSNIDATNVTTFENAFNNMGWRGDAELDFYPPKNINTNIDFGQSSRKMTSESINRIINNLKDRTNTTSKTINFFSNVLTDEQITLVTNKNWIITY